MKHLAVAILLLPTIASAQLKLSLVEFAQVSEDDETRDESGFRNLAGDLSAALGPRMLGPAGTTGAMGFDVSFDLSVTNVDESATHWKKAEDGDAPGAINSMQIQARKGLPYSVELGGSVSHLFGTDLWGLGLNARYAFVEGFKSLPDVCIRANISTVLGSREMSLLFGGGQLIVSKMFGAGGLMSLEPYIGYDLLAVRATSHVIGNPDASPPKYDAFVLKPGIFLRHRGFLGVRVTAAHVAVSVEALIAEGVQTYTAQIGADF